jgi:hypothetical protein
VISFDGVPSYSVSIIEFSGGLVAHETQYCRCRMSSGASAGAVSGR